MKNSTKIPKGTIISGFAGIGKTSAGEKYDNVIDLESGYFFFNLDKSLSQTDLEKLKGSKNRIPNPDGLEDYINAIISAQDNYDYVLIAMFPGLLLALSDRNIDVQIVLPDKEDIDEYQERYLNRGNSNEWTKSMIDRWYEYIDFNLLREDMFKNKPITLDKGGYLSSILDV